MPIYDLFRKTAFDADDLKAMDQAFQALCIELQLNPGDTFRDLVARKVIEFAQRGEMDPERLFELVLSVLPLM